MRATFVSAIILLCLIFANMSSPGPAFAYDESYLPLDAKTLSHRVMQKLIADPLEAGESLVFGKTKVEICGNSILQVRGTDNQSKPWSLIASSWTGCASIWIADLDNNGCEDLIILMRTGGCGWSPNSQLLVLMFEKNGRPFPWAVDGYFDVDSHGVKDFVDLNNNGRAELMRQSRDDGYWITSFYETAKARWNRMHSIDGMAVPLFTRFTQMPNRQAITPPNYRHPFESDLSNNCKLPGSNGRGQAFLDAVDWAKVELSQNPCLLLSNGKHLLPQSSYGSMAVVLDEPDGRRMALLSAGEATHKLLNEICSRRIPVITSGTRTRNSHSPSSELIFASSTSTRSTSLVCSKNRHLQRLDLALSNESDLP